MIITIQLCIKSYKIKILLAESNDYIVDLLSFYCIGDQYALHKSTCRRLDCNFRICLKLIYSNSFILVYLYKNEALGEKMNLNCR